MRVCLGVSANVSPLIFSDSPIELCVMTRLRVRFATGMETVVMTPGRGQGPGVVCSFPGWYSGRDVTTACAWGYAIQESHSLLYSLAVTTL